MICHQSEINPVRRRLPNRIASRFVRIAFAFAAIACAHFPASSGAVVLRVMTYNIRSGNDDLSKTASAIAAESPDIVALQEVDVHWAPRSKFADQATELGGRLHMQVSFAHIYDLPPANPADPRREFGVAILSNYPVSSSINHAITRLSTQETNPVPAAMPGFLETRIEVRGTTVRVFDTHLDYRSDSRVREQQVRDMLTFIGGAETPTILMGDLNASPDAHEIQALRNRLDDAWPDRDGSGFTYPAEAPVKRIDAVLVSGHFRVRSAKVPVTLASDHRPVVAELELLRSR